MTNDTLNLFENPINFSGELTKMLPTSARRLIHQSVETELAAFMADYAHQADANGKPLVVRSSYHPERNIITGIGSVPITIPKARSRGS